MSIKNLTIYASSSDAVPEIFKETARILGHAMLKEGWGLVYGGAHVGLMGEIARIISQGNGYILGVIPEAINDHGLAFDGGTKLIVTKTMHERKQIMEDQGDAFICLPGGFGTLEEMLEVITLRQLGYHTKAIVLLNINHCFDGILSQFEYFYDHSFAKRKNNLIFVANSVDSAIDYLKSYIPAKLEQKWFKEPI